MRWDRVFAWIIAPVACWALVVGAVCLLAAHPVGFIRACYVVGIPTLAYLMVRDYRAWQPRVTMYEWTLAAMVLVACMDITGGLQ